jgi:CheY-like chemotaxis protein
MKKHRSSVQSRRTRSTKTPLCDARAFQRLVVVPQAFVFVLLMVLGTFLGQPLLANVSQLGAVIFLLVINLSVQRYLKLVTLKLLQIHLGALGFFVTLLAIFFGQQSLFSAALPVALILLALSLVPLTWRIAAQLSAPLVAVMLALAILDIVFRGADLVGTAHILMLVIGAALVLVLIALILDRQSIAESAPALFEGMGAVSEIIESKNLSPRPDLRQDMRLRGEGASIFSDELRLDLLWRNSAAVILVAVWLLLWSGEGAARQSLGLFTIAALCLLAGISFYYRIRSAKNGSQLQLLQTLSLLLLFAVVVSPPYFNLIPSHLYQSTSFFVLCAVLALQPVSSFFAGCAVAVIGLLSLSPIVTAHVSFALIIALLFMMAITFLSCLHIYQALQARALTLHLRRCIESGLSTLLCIRLLGEQLLAFFDGERSLLVIGDNKVEALTREGGREMTAEPAYIRALVEKALVQKQLEGIVTPRDLGAQFRPALHDWFGYAPRQLFYVRFTAIVEEQEQEVLLFCPVTWHVRATGIIRSYRFLLGFAALIRGSVAAARSRFQSSDVLLSMQRLLSLREHELADTVHLVNNIAQDIAIQCDELERGEQVVERRALFSVIENLTRNLSAGVSDLKLMRELIRLKQPVRFESVRIKDAFETLRAYSSYRARRRDEHYIFDVEASAHILVKVASREFFETALRLVCKLLSTRIAKGAELLAQIEVFESRVRLKFSWQGQNFDTSLLRAVEEDGSEQESEVIEINQVRAVRTFAIASGGSLSVVYQAPQQRGELILELALALAVAEKRAGEEGGWALLVDDNPQVTEFYARVAKALALPYYLAASTEEAERLVVEHGRPRLVVSDIQLGEGSGLQLVRTFRSQFGPEIPIIVVSGQTSDSYGNDVSTVGATRFLTKPVSRSRLFTEIRELLGL